MKLLFNLIWFFGVAVLLVTCIWGYSGITVKQRIIASVGLIASSILVAAQGMVFFIGGFWIFPLGLYHGYFQLRGININSIGPPPEWLYPTVWVLYLSLSVAFVFYGNLTLRRFIWTILIVALLGNIGGCHTMVSSMKGIP